MKKSVFYVVTILALGVGWQVGQRNGLPAEESKVNHATIAEIGEELPNEFELPSERPPNSGKQAEPNWEALFSNEHLEALVKALREAGFSHESVENYVTVRLQEEMGMYDILYPLSERWWETVNSSNLGGARLSEVNYEVTRKVAELLGDKVETEGEARLRNYRFGNIPLEKTRQINELLRQRSLAQMRRQEKDDGVSFPEEYVAFHQSLREILTDSEYREYLVRSGREASSLKRKLQFLDVTEEQFESVAWRLEMLQLDMQEHGNDRPVDFYERRVNQNQVSREIRAILGDALYFEYSRNTTGETRPYTYDGLVSPTTILAAEEIKFRRYDEVYHVFKNYGPTDPLRSELRAQVDNRHFSEAKMLMSADEFRAYRASSYGRWISSRFESPGG